MGEAPKGSIDNLFGPEKPALSHEPAEPTHPLYTSVERAMQEHLPDFMPRPATGGSQLTTTDGRYWLDLERLREDDHGVIVDEWEEGSPHASI